MVLKVDAKKIIGYLLIYFMLIWNQSNLGKIYLKKFAPLVLVICAIALIIKSKKLSKWCGLCAFVLVISMILLRIFVGGICVDVVISFLSSVYLVGITVAYNKNEIYIRVINVIVFLAGASLILWIITLLFPTIYEMLIPRYETLMQYKIYSDAITFEEFNYGARGLFLYTMREVDKWRNTGIFTEPGIFQMVLNTGIFICLFMEDKLQCKNVKKKVLLLVTTLCTTQSTTGFIGLILIILFYMVSRSKEKRIFNKQTILIFLLVGGIILLADYQMRGSQSILQITLIDKLFSKGSISLIDNASSMARVGTIILTIGSILHHPFGIGYTNLNSLLRTDKTGFVAAEILTFGAVWGIIPLIFVLWWIFAPVIKKISKSATILFILLYINTLLAQSNMFYPILILIPMALRYQKRM